jgi:hypothetical protein
MVSTQKRAGRTLDNQFTCEKAIYREFESGFGGVLDGHLSSELHGYLVTSRGAHS